jgi:hypothetical protein
LSWTQGVQVREDLPEWFRIWADAQATKDGICEALVWDITEPGLFHLDYYNETGIVESLSFRKKL